MNSSHLFILRVVVHCPCADAVLLGAALVVGRVVIPSLHAAVRIVFLAIDRIDLRLLQTLAHAEHIRAFTLEVAVGLEHVDQAHKSHEDRD